MLKHVPAKQLSLKPIEELSRKIRRYSRGGDAGDGAAFATDFLRLRRDLRDAEHLTTCMERVHLVTDGKSARAFPVEQQALRVRAAGRSQA